MSFPNRRRGGPTGLLPVLWLHLCLGFLFAPPAAVAESRRSFAIPAATAEVTLEAFLDQANSQVVYPIEDVRGVATNPVFGEFTPAEALARLVAGTGLRAFQDERTAAFVIKRGGTPPPPDAAENPTPESRESMKKSSRTRLAAALAGLAASLLPAQPATPPAQDDPIQLSPFTVQSGENTYTVANAMTGTRINTPLVDAPFAVQVVTDQFIRDTGAGSLNEALRYVSSVRSGRNISETFYVRGFAAGVPLRNYFALGSANRMRSDNAEYDRIEVLKGPTSLLYGVGGPGGRINTVTKQPLGVRRHSLEVEAGSYDHYRTTLDFTGPLARWSGGRELRYRLIAVHHDSAGYRDFEYVDREFVNAQLEWRSPRLTLRGEFRLLAQIENETFILMPIAPAQGIIAWPERSYNTSGPETFGRVREYNGYTEAVLRLNDRWSVRNGSTIGQQYYDAIRRNGAGLVAPAFTHVRNSGNYNDELAETLATQTDLTGRVPLGFGTLTLVGGFIYERGDDRNIRWQLDALPNALFPVYDRAARRYSIGERSDYYLAQSDRTESKANRIYGMSQLSLFDDRLLLLGGAGRIDSESELTNRRPATPTVTRSSLTKTVPQGGASYKLRRGLNVYAMYGETFAPNARFPNDPEQGNSVELGLKVDHERISGTLALFDTKRENIPANVFDYSTNTTVFGVGGKEAARGVELDLYVRPSRNYDVIASFAFLDTEVVTSDDEVARPDRKGTPLGNAPRHQGKLWIKRTLAKGFLGFERSWAGIGLIYVGSMRPDDDPSRYKLIAPSYTRVDLAVGATRQLSDSLHLDARLGVTNLFNEDYLDNQITRGAPTIVKGSLGLRF